MDTILNNDVVVLFATGNEPLTADCCSRNVQIDRIDMVYEGLCCLKIEGYAL